MGEKRDGKKKGLCKQKECGSGKKLNVLKQQGIQRGEGKTVLDQTHPTVLGKKMVS